MGTKLVGDHLSRGTKFLGTICPWGQNWLGTVCPEGPINWGPNVGDQMSGDHMGLGPNVLQPIFHTQAKVYRIKVMYCRHGGVVQSGASCYTAASVIRRYEDIIKKVIYYLARNLLVVNAEIGYIILANLAENSTRKYQNVLPAWRGTVGSCYTAASVICR